MVNTDDFIKRLEEVLNFYQLSASAFADQIGVQRSSLSHLLSGRNKPSLDFVLKVCEVFDQVTLPWFLKGEGHFPKNVEGNQKTILQNDITNLSDVKWNENESATLFDLPTVVSNDKEKNADIPVVNQKLPFENEVMNESFQSNEGKNVTTNPMRLMNKEHNKEVDFVVVFYKDGSCSYYKNN